VREDTELFQKMNIKQFLRALCPPIIADALSSLAGRRISFSGIYLDWNTASEHADGYATENILERATAATKKVISGEAKFDRDGVTFNDNSYPFPVIALLLRAASENNGTLTVLDFGGSLGSSYYQCRHFLEGVEKLRWCVVEQSHFVDAGNRSFSSDKLLFFKDMKTVLANHRPNVVLFSGVLQYLPKPYEVLREAIDSLAEYIIVDRNPFIEANASILSVQRIPKQIVKSSYPAWLFSETEFRRFFSGKYMEIATFEALDGAAGRGRLKVKFKGMVLRKVSS
jgi:putative methyltransferase (TIGR04325 family)